jgi:putative nucleotidyltransferase with HDIG domain
MDRLQTEFNILVISGESEDRETIADNLPDEQFHVAFAENPEMLKEALSKGTPDLVFLSMDLEGINALTLCERLSGAGIGVAMVSSEVTRRLVLDLYGRGALDLFARPLRPGLLVERTERALQRLGKKLSVKNHLELDFNPAAKPREKVQLLLKETEEILALPFAVAEIIRLCNDPATSAQDLEKPVRSDPATTAMIMRRANSARYAGKATTIDRGIVRIGLRATRNIVASFSVFNLFSAEDKSLGFNRIWFWFHSLASGLCAQNIATLLRYKLPEDAFMAGLLHDIGKIVLDDFVNEDYQKALQSAHSEKKPLRIAEESVFETQHPYVGAKVAKLWGFPSSIVEAISDHHSYNDFARASSDLSLSAIVCMANHMTKALQVGNGGDANVEVEATGLWDCLPKELVWKEIEQNILGELKEYVADLNVPPDQCEVEMPEETEGKAGIYVPGSPNYGTLLQIALERLGLETVCFASIDEKDNAEDRDFKLVLADLTSVKDEEELDQHKEALAKLTKKSLILPERDDKGRPRHLDFLWLESEVKKMLGA